MRVMLIDEEAERAAWLEQALLDAGYPVVARCTPHSDIQARVAAIQPDVIVIDMQCPDRDILEDMGAISRAGPRPIVMFAGNDDRTTIEAAVRAGVSAYVVDGLSEKRVRPIVDVAIARFREFQALRVELARTQNDLAERKEIERAKGLLMTRRGFSEEQAYGALRKMAMDRNQRLIEVARSVILAADLLG